ncbi:low molecular weight protein-tyrosine-phosphatase [Ferrimonas senticii]|uniref:low molecular weight protein-tyrosine-phosphatase n=1 Tax=Ferrimonas senticii TaxID=394566 RepID=UPI000416ED52|nr:low molecular weight protein-tyrosine-phosphatase [Ferrimonas senticii]
MDVDYRQLKSVLFVCLGNICRSPTAEAVFRTKARQRGVELQFDSAGITAFHQGQRPDRRTIEAGRKRGFDFANMSARQIEMADFHRFDLILAADKQNLADLHKLADRQHHDKIGLILSLAGSNKEVPDPYYGGNQGFERVLDLLEDAADKLLAKI